MMQEQQEDKAFRGWHLNLPSVCYILAAILSLSGLLAFQDRHNGPLDFWQLFLGGFILLLTWGSLCLWSNSQWQTLAGLMALLAVCTCHLYAFSVWESLAYWDDELSSFRVTSWRIRTYDMVIVDSYLSVMILGGWLLVAQVPFPLLGLPMSAVHLEAFQRLTLYLFPWMDWKWQGTSVTASLVILGCCGDKLRKFSAGGSKTDLGFWPHQIAAAWFLYNAAFIDPWSGIPVVLIAVGVASGLVLGRWSYIAAAVILAFESLAVISKDLVDIQLLLLLLGPLFALSGVAVSSVAGQYKKTKVA